MTTAAPPKPVGRRGDGPTHRRPRESASPVTGTGALLRLYLRLSRRALIIWTLAMLVSIPFSILAMEQAYPDQAALDARALLLDNPSAVMMTGPYFAGSRYTFWAMVANELFLYVLIAVAIMSILLTVRHTRAEEEAGRFEMTRALPTGRHAPSAAAFGVVLVANLAVGAAAAAGALMVGGPVTDSLALGAATALTGLVFAAIAAVTAQITEHAGSASGMALGIMALAFMVRGIGDVMNREGSWLSWFSPFAWAQQTRVYVDLRGWPLLVSLAATLALLALAEFLSRRRDVGAGLRPARSGRAEARRGLLRPGGLARRLLRATMLAWGIGLFLFAISFGALASSLGDLIAQMPAVSDWAPISLTDLTGSYAAFVLQMLTIGPLALLVSAVLRMRTEEQAGRLAPLLISGTSRTALALWWFVVAVVAAALMQVALGLGVGLGVWAATEQTRWIGDLTLASLAYLPAIALVGALALALYGLSLRSTGLAWLVVVYTSLVVFLADMLGLPDWARAISPLDHVSLVPSEDLRVAPLVVMGAAAVVLVVVGILGLRRRDLTAG